MIDLSGISAIRGQFTLMVNQLQLQEGELVAVLGNNGSGKSTFFSALSGFLEYDGDYRIREADYKSYDHISRKKLVGLLPQKTELNMPFDVYYVILTGRFAHTDGYRYAKSDHQSTEAVIDRFDIKHLRHRAFNELSGGEKQRVLLARAINHGAPVLLLDEPLNGIDIKHQHETVRHLHALKAEKIILVVMHDLTLAMREFDRFLVFDRGNLVYDASKETLDSARLAEIFKVKIDFLNMKEKLYVYTALEE